MSRYTGPKRVNAGPFVYEVLCSKDKWKKRSVRDCGGETDNAHLTINIMPGLARGVQREVMMHELVHVAANALGSVLFGHRPRKMDEEEAAAVMLAPMLLEIMRRNPALVRWLLAD